MKNKSIFGEEKAAERSLLLVFRIKRVKVSSAEFSA